jgi:hypothetical protein
VHPTDDQLIDFLVGGPVAMDDTEGVREHLAHECPLCTGRARRFRDLIQVLRADRDPEPPAEWVRRAVALGAPEPLSALVDRVRSFCGELVEQAARLVRDTAAGPASPAFGLRGEAARRLGFETGEVELDLAIDPRPGGASVTGQLVSLAGSPSGAADARVLLAAEPDGIWETTTDPDGEFALDVNRPWPLRMYVALEGRLVLFDIPTPPET